MPYLALAKITVLFYLIGGSITISSFTGKSAEHLFARDVGKHLHNFGNIAGAIVVAQVVNAGVNAKKEEQNHG